MQKRTATKNFYWITEEIQIYFGYHIVELMLTFLGVIWY